MPTIEETLARLEKSDLRAKFHLSAQDRCYIADKGINAVRLHAKEFVRTRLAAAEPPNDGKQTPMRGHPVFVAPHACACCCRGCLEKWYRHITLVKRGFAGDGFFLRAESLYDVYLLEDNERYDC